MCVVRLICGSGWFADGWMVVNGPSVPSFLFLAHGHTPQISHSPTFCCVLCWLPCCLVVPHSQLPPHHHQLLQVNSSSKQQDTKTHIIWCCSTGVPGQLARSVRGPDGFSGCVKHTRTQQTPSRPRKLGQSACNPQTDCCWTCCFSVSAFSQHTACC